MSVSELVNVSVSLPSGNVGLPSDLQQVTCGTSNFQLSASEVVFLVSFDSSYSVSLLENVSSLVVRPREWVPGSGGPGQALVVRLAGSSCNLTLSTLKLLSWE